MKRVISFVKSETVLSAAAALAVLSAFFVPPDGAYLSYIDLRTLAILFSLMAVMCGFRSQGVFDRMGAALLQRTASVLQAALALTALCFFSSMLITNDVALITFVPLTFVVLNMLGAELRNKWALQIVAMQTVAANLGSMLTPLGNPQNLYLYGRGGMSLLSFMGLMLPYCLISLFLLVLWACIFGRGANAAATGISWQPEKQPDKKKLMLYGGLFVLCLLTVVRLIPYQLVFAVVLAAVLLADKKVVSQVDYSLLLTFVAFFVFIGNLGRLSTFSSWLRSILEGREVPVAVLVSQVTSNVPAALLLSGFTDKVSELVIGTNLGGLGTLIASMASLISYRQIAREEPERKGEYFRLFTLSNVVFLIILMAAWLLLR